MRTVMNRKTYYTTTEACRKAGISRATFFRWLKEGIIEDAECKDRRGWRLFAKRDIDRIKAEAGKTVRPRTAFQGVEDERHRQD